jgi:hypothetical protein
MNKKTILTIWEWEKRITALSNHSELPAFFSLRQVTLKISHRILPIPTIPEDDLPRMAKFRCEVGQISAYDKPESQKKI